MCPSSLTMPRSGGGGVGLDAGFSPRISGSHLGQSVWDLWWTAVVIKATLLPRVVWGFQLLVSKAPENVYLAGAVETNLIILRFRFPRLLVGNTVFCTVLYHRVEMVRITESLK
jgi:hypothetical protein